MKVKVLPEPVGEVRIRSRGFRRVEGVRREGRRVDWRGRRVGCLERRGGRRRGWRRGERVDVGVGSIEREGESSEEGLERFEGGSEESEEEEEDIVALGEGKGGLDDATRDDGVVGFVVYSFQISFNDDEARI